MMNTDDNGAEALSAGLLRGPPTPAQESKKSTTNGGVDRVYRTAVQPFLEVGSSGYTAVIQFIFTLTYDMMIWWFYRSPHRISGCNLETAQAGQHFYTVRLYSNY